MPKKASKSKKQQKVDMEEPFNKIIFNGLLNEDSLQEFIIKTLFSNKEFNKIFTTIISDKYSDEEENVISNIKDGKKIIQKLRLYKIIDNEYPNLSDVEITKLNSSDTFDFDEVRRILKGFNKTLKTPSKKTIDKINELMNESSEESSEEESSEDDLSEE